MGTTRAAARPKGRFLRYFSRFFGAAPLENPPLCPPLPQPPDGNWGEGGGAGAPLSPPRGTKTEGFTLVYLILHPRPSPTFTYSRVCAHLFHRIPRFPGILFYPHFWHRPGSPPRIHVHGGFSQALTGEIGLSEIRNVFVEVSICPETMKLHPESLRETHFGATATCFEFAPGIPVIPGEDFESQFPRTRARA